MKIHLSSVYIFLYILSVNHFHSVNFHLSFSPLPYIYIYIFTMYYNIFKTSLWIQKIHRQCQLNNTNVQGSHEVSYHELKELLPPATKNDKLNSGKKYMEPNLTIIISEAWDCVRSIAASKSRQGFRCGCINLLRPKDIVLLKLTEMEAKWSVQGR